MITLPERSRGSRKVLLIGWDGADWKVITPLMDAGKMPVLAGFVEQGVMGNLATLYPDLSPMLWSSIATGQRPFRHGVLGFSEPDPQTGYVRPISVLSRKTKAIWNILNQERRQSVVVGWWPSHPAEPINGVMVSDHYKTATAPFDKPWPLRPGAIHPPRLTRILTELRRHPQAVDPGLVQLFVPRLAEIDQDTDHRIESMAKIIAEATTITTAAQAILHHEPWDFAAVYLDAIDHFCHGFMHYHPPKTAWVSEDDFQRYQGVVESGYIYHDILLGRLLREVDEETTVLLVSDHGFHSDHLRPGFLPKEPAGPAAQHRHFGIFAARGPNIKQDELIYGAGLLDICPTILTLFRLPIGQDMDGKPLVNIFRKPPRILSIPSWEAVPGRDGRHAAEVRMDPVEAAQAMQQLVDLGYIERPPDDRAQAVAETVRELDFNLARSYMDALRHSEATQILERLHADWPDEYRFGITLANCCFAMGQIARARTLIDRLFALREANRLKARERLREILGSGKDGEAVGRLVGESVGQVVGESVNQSAGGSVEPSAKEPGGSKGENGQREFSQAEQREIRNLRAEVNRPVYALEYLAGCILHEEGRDEQALEHLERAMLSDSSQVALYVKLAEVYLRIARTNSLILEKAGEACDKALLRDPDNPSAWLGLARVHLRQGRDQDAAEAAMTSVGLVFHNPMAHFLLGNALVRLGEVGRAVDALKVAVTQNPNFVRAWSMLAFLYQRFYGDTEQQDACRGNARQALRRIREIRENSIDLSELRQIQARRAVTSDQIQPEAITFPAWSEPVDMARTVVIVSGLPRSGTSMLMQMLQRGGLPVLTDGRRPADQSNPEGYFEHDQAKNPAKFPDLLATSRGHAVKIVAQLLPKLPRLADISYRVLLIERHQDEVIASQQTMLHQEAKSGGGLAPDKLAAVFADQMLQVKKFLRAANIPTLILNYNQTILDPQTTANQIAAFLGQTINSKTAAKAVTPDLYRQRAEK
jgi:predicted AlkP superfamily phosphohydrolase/phosphomutase/predicted Zn-dependent protease